MICTVACAALIATSYVSHVIVSAEQQRTVYADHIAAVATMATAAMSAEPSEHRQSKLRERFSSWAQSATSDPAIVAAALLGPLGDVLELVPDDLADRPQVAAALRRGSWPDGINWPMRKLAWSVHRGMDGLRVILLHRPLASLTSPIASSVPFLIISLVSVVVIVTCLQLSLKRAIINPLQTCIEMTSPCLKNGRGRLDRPHQVGFDQLIRNVSLLIDRDKSSRARLGQLKRTMDARVTHQTRQIESMLKRAEREAWIDPLTKLGNRRLLDDRLASLFQEHSDGDDDLAVILLDLDNFKSLNDTFGHAAGDEALAFMGELLRGTLRSSDVGLRLGGDEFGVLLLGAGIDEAAETADRIIKLFDQRVSAHKSIVDVSLSAGVASLKYHHPSDGAGLMKAGDAGLYQAKRAGKSRVGIVSRAAAALASAPAA